jgi:hypothetical protein
MPEASVLDEVIHQSTRLRIMTVLNVLKRDEWMEFVRLKALLEVSDGNLGSHLETLQRASYVEIDKQIVGRKPQTRIRPTSAGRSAYRQHVNALKALLEL